MTLRSSSAPLPTVMAALGNSPLPPLPPLNVIVPAEMPSVPLTAAGLAIQRLPLPVSTRPFEPASTEPIVPLLAAMLTVPPASVSVPPVT